MPLAIQTAGTAALTLGNSNGGVIMNGSVGIGTTSPSGKLAVEGSGGGGVDVLFKNSGGNLRLNLIAEASSADINFGDNASYVGNGRIRYDNSTNDLSFMTNGGERLRITAAGNVGIGTTTPGAKLHVLESSGEGNPAISPGEILRLQRNSASNSTAGIFIIGGTQATNYIFLGSANGYSAGGTLTYNNASDFLTLGTAGAEKLRITSTGNVGIGTTTPWGKLSITGSGTGTGLAFAVADSANTPRFVIQDNGNVGIGTTSPTAQLHTTGTVRFSNFGAGTFTTDASGNLSVSSDERLKNIDGAFTRGLADIVKLNPISYHWNAIPAST